MSLPWQGLGKPVGRHFGGADPFCLNSSLLNLLSKPVIGNINVLKFCGEQWRFLGEETDRLLVVAADSGVMIGVQLN